MASSDARNKLEDLSGIVLQPGENPYAAFIKACNDDPAEIRALYAAHRTKRNAQQREKFLSPDYKELVIDQHLLRLETQPGFVDERNCMVFWARPSDKVIQLAAKVQAMLQDAAPSIWLMPTHRMHMTTLEVAFSKTPEEISALVDQLRPALPEITSYLHGHRSRLVKPMVSYDLSAFALSFEPVDEETYTYHHVRRDVFDLVKKAGIEVGSRYQVPSAHITLGRYLGEADHDTPEKREQWIHKIDEVNAWLEKETIEWAVGEERGLDARAGALWYGGGRTILLGEGF